VTLGRWSALVYVDVRTMTFVEFPGRCVFWWIGQYSITNWYSL